MPVVPTEMLLEIITVAAECLSIGDALSVLKTASVSWKNIRLHSQSRMFKDVAVYHDKEAPRNHPVALCTMTWTNFLTFCCVPRAWRIRDYVRRLYFVDYGFHDPTAIVSPMLSMSSLTTVDLGGLVVQPVELSQAYRFLAESTGPGFKRACTVILTLHLAPLVPWLLRNDPQPKFVFDLTVRAGGKVPTEAAARTKSLFTAVGFATAHVPAYGEYSSLRFLTIVIRHQPEAPVNVDLAQTVTTLTATDLVHTLEVLKFRSPREAGELDDHVHEHLKHVDWAGALRAFRSRRWSCLEGFTAELVVPVEELPEMFPGQDLRTKTAILAAWHAAAMNGPCTLLANVFEEITCMAFRFLVVPIMDA